MLVYALLIMRENAETLGIKEVNTRIKTLYHVKNVINTKIIINNCHIRHILEHLI